jgi:hypothetical protein
MKRVFLFALFALNVVIAAQAGQTIDFETLPDGSIPYDGMAISNQWISLGVTFRFGNGGIPILVTPGGTNYAFLGPPNSTITNQPAPGQNVGRFFVSDRASGQPRNFIIEYTSPVSAASGAIIDIDHKDAWAIEPRDINDLVLSNYVVNLDTNSVNSGDGIATPWSISAPTPMIYSIRIRYTGSTSQPGLAFDNFSPTNALPTPAPAQLALALNPTNALLTVTGTPSALYRIERAAKLAPTNWNTVTNIYLPASSVTIADPGTTAGTAFYRAIGLQ